MSAPRSPARDPTSWTGGCRARTSSWRAPARRPRRTPSTPSWSSPGTPTPPPGPRPSRTRRSTASMRRDPRSSTRSRPSPSSSSRTVPASRPRSWPSARARRSRAPRSGGRSPARSTATRSSTAAFPAGTTVPSHLTPCIVDGACGGPGWYEFNAPAGAAALATEGFDLERTYPLHVPDGPVPGLPDPSGAAEAVKAQLETNLGLKVDDRRHARGRLPPRPWTTARSTASTSTAWRRRSPMRPGSSSRCSARASGRRPRGARRAWRQPSSGRPPRRTPATGPRPSPRPTPRSGMPPSSCRSRIPARPSRSAATSRAW